MILRLFLSALLFCLFLLALGLMVPCLRFNIATTSICWVSFPSKLAVELDIIPLLCCHPNFLLKARTCVFMIIFIANHYEEYTKEKQNNKYVERYNVF